MNPERFKAWQLIVRDLVIVGVATFVLLFETVAAKEPNTVLVGAALTLYGLPPLLRLDERRGGKDSDEK